MTLFMAGDWHCWYPLPVSVARSKQFLRKKLGRKMFFLLILLLQLLLLLQRGSCSAWIQPLLCHCCQWASQLWQVRQLAAALEELVKIARCLPVRAWLSCLRFKQLCNHTAICVQNRTAACNCSLQPLTHRANKNQCKLWYKNLT